MSIAFYIFLSDSHLLQTAAAVAAARSVCSAGRGADEIVYAIHVSALRMLSVLCEGRFDPCITSPLVCSRWLRKSLACASGVRREEGGQNNQALVNAPRLIQRVHIVITLSPCSQLPHA